MIPNANSLLSTVKRIKAKCKTSNVKPITLKQQRLIDNIPSSSTMMEAGIKSGYAPKSGNIYRQNIKQHIQSVMDRGSVTAQDIEALHLGLAEASMTADKKPDFTNATRNVEGLGRIKGVYIDKVDQNVNMSGELNTISHDAPDDELFNVCKNLKARRAQALRQ